MFCALQQRLYPMDVGAWEALARLLHRRMAKEDAQHKHNGFNLK